VRANVENPPEPPKSLIKFSTGRKRVLNRSEQGK
jgi:hypothetical protein